MEAVSAAADESLTFELERFIYHEANLLDDRRYEEWLELLADDVTYWIPNFSENAPPGEGVIVLERLPALRARVARALDPENPTQMPPARTRHFFSNVIVTVPTGSGSAVVTSSLLMYVSKDHRLLPYPGKCEHTLRREGDRWRIVAKTINLIGNAEPVNSLPII